MLELMRYFFCFSALIFLLSTGYNAHSETEIGKSEYQDLSTQPIPARELARWAEFSQPSLSSDGKHVLATIKTGNHDLPLISIWETADLSKKPIWLPTKEMLYVYAAFLGPEKILWVAQDKLIRGSYKHLDRQIHIADLDGSNRFEPFDTPGTDTRGQRAMLGGSIFYVFPDRERFYLAKTTFESGQEIIEWNSKTGRKRNVAVSGKKYAYSSEAIDPISGDLLLRETVEPIEGGSYNYKRYLRKDEKSVWEYHPKLSYTFEKRSTLTPLGFDQNTDRLVVLSDQRTEHTNVRVYNISSKKWDPEPLFSVPNFSIINIIEQTSTKGAFPEIIGIVVGGPKPEQFFFDDYWSKISNALKKQFPEANITLSDLRLPWQAGRYMALVSIESASQPTEYLLYDDGKLKKLGSLRPWLNNKKASLPTAEWITYPAGDGLEIPGILSLPHGYDKDIHGPIPLVVHPHGGPWSRDYMGWDISGWIPFLTSRGIAVLQPQYRGSAGLGQTLWKSGDKEWGQKMQDDKDDGAKWLVKEGIADPKRIAIYGYSYGGFAAIAASVRSNSPYQCAISGAGVSNLDKLGNIWGANRIQRAYQGWTVGGMDPIENVKNASIPILLYHGDHDRQADTKHSVEFYRAMKSADKDVVYHEIDGMWHQFPFRPEWQVQIFGWLDGYLSSEKCGLIDNRAD